MPVSDTHTPLQLVIECCNALAGAFLLTEGLLGESRRRSSWWSQRSNRRSLYIGGAALLLANLFAFAFVVQPSPSPAAAASSVSTSSSDHHGLLSLPLALAATPFVWVAGHVGSSVLIAALLSAAACAAWWARTRGGGGQANVSRLYGGLLGGWWPAAALALFLILLLLLRLAGVDALVHHTVALKIVAIAGIFLLVNFVDVKRLDPAVDLSSYSKAFAAALLYAIPAFPVAAVAISVCFLVIVSAMEAVSIDPHWINSPVYYGTVYGPFYVLYWRIKRELLGSSRPSLLPTSGAGGTGGTSGSSSGANNPSRLLRGQFGPVNG